MNTPPEFSEPLPTVFNIELVNSEDDIIEDDSSVKFTSPKATDAEKDQISFDIDTGGQSFMRAKKNSDHFVLHVNRGLVPKKSGSYPIKIKLSDSKGAKALFSQTIEIVVTYVDKHAQAKEAAEKVIADAEEAEQQAL